jgi:hypothetical protein
MQYLSSDEWHKIQASVSQDIDNVEEMHKWQVRQIDQTQGYH